MKTSVIFFAIMLIAIVAFGQEQKLNEIKVTAPNFQSDLFKSVNDYLNHTVQYPVKSKNTGLQGTEVVQFIVSADGKISDFMVINSVSSEIDREVIRILEITDGKWTPGTVNGEPVAMKNEVSVTFFLHSERELIKMAKHYQQKGNNWMYVKNNPEKALVFYTRGIVLLPNEESLLAARGLCKYEMGDKTGAISDWERLKILAERNGVSPKLDNMVDKVVQMPGFAQMMEIINK